ncbi:ABC transporter ATP-binding protein [Bermanella sp. WJH001]|uniref:ABC transporter ATP-binding protein n=1 Tax=Bermanella sp. WJH001 TaxID=3048005 RepID=UPI0024BE4A5C|nr:ABC transporter ATP-binding protein [Bermanella sp. WJH001]MDJ1539138.1 ABC transporter ATP-binding protein [Bermanella sp. WJH001]
MALLETQNLCWQVADNIIVDDVNFSIHKGQFVGLIGPNGAGKSSLMRCLYRVNKPSTGQVLFEQQDVWQLSAKENAKKMSVILQEHSDHLGLTVRDVVSQGLTPHKSLFQWDDEQDAKNIRAVMQQVDIEALKHKPFQLLSGGEKQRVMLARALAQNTELVIMDEPTNHLDVHYQTDMMAKVKSLNKTILASFHDLNLAAAFCDHILVLDKGKLVASGAPSQVLTQTLINDVFRTQAIVDAHPVNGHPRITYQYHV